jgi:hypothetical protein
VVDDNSNKKEETMQINAEQVKSVYSGKDGKCCCGCSGKHSEDKTTIKRTVNKINKHVNDWDVGTDYIAVVVGTRLHIAYFN